MRTHCFGPPIILLCVFVLLSPNRACAEAGDYDSPIDSDSGLFLGLGGGLVHLDTSFSFEDKDTGLGGIIDAESSIGLDENQTIPFLAAGYTFNHKHSLDFSFFRINRDSTLVDIDTQWDDIRVVGDAELTDKTRFYYLNYGYSLFRDDRTLVKLRAGLYVLDLQYSFSARGSISVGGTPVPEDVYERDFSQIAPLPLLGLDLWFKITPRWSFGAEFGLVAGSYKNVSATVFDAAMVGRYAVTPNFGLNIGAVSLSADIIIENDKSESDIKYSYDGLYLGLDYRF